MRSTSFFGDDLLCLYCVDVRQFSIASYDVSSFGKRARHIAMRVHDKCDGHIAAYNLPYRAEQIVFERHADQVADSAGAMKLEIDAVNLAEVFLQSSENLVGDILKASYSIIPLG